MPVPFDRPQAFELNTAHADRAGDRRYTCAGCAHLGAAPNFLNRYDRSPAQPACARSSSKLPTLSTNDGAVHGLFRISLGSLLPGFEVLGNDRKVARDGRLSNIRDRRVRDPAPHLLEVLVGVTGPENRRAAYRAEHILPSATCRQDTSGTRARWLSSITD